MGENDIADFTLDENTIVDTDRGLATQDLGKLDVNSLTAETFEVMSRQATVNVGTIGHVAHGKSTVVKALSGVKTQKYHREAVMNITIHLGYANAKVYQCEKCPRPSCFHAFPSSQPDSTPCPTCGTTMVLRRHFSFVDCPGHDVLMATMLNGAAIMDAALLLIAANESFPQPQTLEHLAAVEIMKLRHLIVLQNKVDVVPYRAAMVQAQEIRRYLLSHTTYGEAPMLPLSAQLAANVDYLLEYLLHIPLPRRILRARARLHVMRSFDVTLPGGLLDSLVGGVVGGTVEQGVICVGDTIELLPGMICLARRDGSAPSRENVLRGLDLAYFSAPPPGQLYCYPVRTTVRSLMAENNSLQYAVPGGLVAVGTLLDPSITRQNKLRGQVLHVVHSSITGYEEANIPSADGNDPDVPQVLQEVDIQFYLLKELLGVQTARKGHPMYNNPFGRGSAHMVHSPQASTHARMRVSPLKEGECIVINVSTLTTAATVLRTARAVGRAICRLESPVCACTGDSVVLARYVDRKVRLIGWGVIRRAIPVPLIR